MRKVLVALVAALVSLPVLADVTGLVSPPGGGGGSSLPSQTGNSGKFLTTDGTSPSWASPTASASSITPGTTTVVGATAPCLIDNSATTVMGCLAETGTGSAVLATSPTLVTPNLGTPSAINLTNATALTTSALPAFSGDCSSTAGTASLTCSKVNGASVPASASCLGSNSGSQLVNCSQPINAQGSPVGNAYTIASTDANKLITFSDASAVAVTLPVATTTGFTAGFAFTVQNLGAGLVTITPTTSTINGAATLTIPENMGCSVVSDGTNYQVGACTALLSNWLNAASSGTSVTPICQPGLQRTVTTVTATGNFTINAPTGCTEGQQVMLKITYTASDTYTWNAAYHANAANPGALPTATGGASGVDMFIFYDDAANSRFDYLAEAPAF